MSHLNDRIVEVKVEVMEEDSPTETYQTSENDRVCIPAVDEIPRESCRGKPTGGSLQNSIDEIEEKGNYVCKILKECTHCGSRKETESLSFNLLETVADDCRAAYLETLHHSKINDEWLLRTYGPAPKFIGRTLENCTRCDKLRMHNLFSRKDDRSYLKLNLGGFSPVIFSNVIKICESKGNAIKCRLIDICSMPRSSPAFAALHKEKDSSDPKDFDSPGTKRRPSSYGPTMHSKILSTSNYSFLSEQIPSTTTKNIYYHPYQRDIFSFDPSGKSRLSSESEAAKERFGRPPADFHEHTEKLAHSSMSKDFEKLFANSPHSRYVTSTGTVFSRGSSSSNDPTKFAEGICNQSREDSPSVFRNSSVANNVTRQLTPRSFTSVQKSNFGANDPAKVLRPDLMKTFAPLQSYVSSITRLSSVTESPSPGTTIATSTNLHPDNCVEERNLSLRERTSSDLVVLKSENSFTETDSVDKSSKRDLKLMQRATGTALPEPRTPNVSCTTLSDPLKTFSFYQGNGDELSRKAQNDDFHKENQSKSSAKHLIPRVIIDDGESYNVGNVDMFDPRSVNCGKICNWSNEDVVAFFNETDCVYYSPVFEKEEIDGKALLLLNEEKLNKLLGIKIGPAMKLARHIENLKSCLSNDGNSEL